MIQTNNQPSERKNEKSFEQKNKFKRIIKPVKYNSLECQMRSFPVAYLFWNIHHDRLIFNKFRNGIIDVRPTGLPRDSFKDIGML